MLLSDKYSPKTLDEVVGNPSAISRIKVMGNDAKKGLIGKPLMLCGPSGVGKTCAAHALADTFGFETLELSASDYRDSETLRKTLLPAGNTSNLFKKRVLVILDEVDELSSKADSGAEKVIVEMIKKSRQPVLFIANDYWDRKITFLRELVEKCDFKKLTYDEVKGRLRFILEKEGKTMPDDIIDEIALKSSGDLRGAINDLELMIGADPDLRENLGYRNRKAEIYAVLDKIFLTNSFSLSRGAAADADVDLGMLINWVDENIPNRYVSKRSRSDAMESVSMASAFLEKAGRSGHYDYLKYSSILASSGVSLASNGSFTMLKQYTFPANIRFLSKTKKSRSELKSITTKLVYHMHAGKGNVSGTYLTMFKAMISRANKEYGMERVYEFFETKYGLGKEEVDAIAASRNY